MSTPPSPLDRKGFSPWQFGLLLAALIFTAFPQVILGMETFVARDYGFFVYPLAHFQRDCFWRGDLPFWEPYNNCGVPFLAQWNTMPLYPPALLYLLLPLTWALSLFSLAHLWFGGMGMYFLARRWTGSAFGAAFAGTVFSFNGLTLNLIMWPSHIATFSWLPWVALAVETAWRRGGGALPVAAGAGALQMLAGGPETIFLTWLLILALWVEQFVSASAPRRRMLWTFPAIIALVMALSAVQLAPFLDLVMHAQREAGYTDLRWSMPAFGWANFLVPMAFGNTVTEGIFFQHGQYWTSSYYLGLATLWLALMALFSVRNQRVRLLAAITVVSLICALGENTPFYPLLRKVIPQLTFITYPVKYVMVSVFAAPLLAAFALAAISNKFGISRNRPPTKKLLGIVGGILLLAIAGITIWTQKSPMASDDSRGALTSGLSREVLLLITAVPLFVLTSVAKPAVLRWMPLALILIVWLDVFTQGPPQNPTVSPMVYQLNLARTRLAMSPQPELGQSRAMLLPEAALDLTRFGAANPRDNFLAKRAGYCANVNLLDAVPKVDGFFSLSPRDFDRLLMFRYNVTNGSWRGLDNFMGVSQFGSETSLLAWTPRAGFLPLVTAGQKPVYLNDTDALLAFGQDRFDGTRVVFLPPSESAQVQSTNETSVTLSNVKCANNTVDFDAVAAAPTLAVVAQTFYHDWHAQVDGQSAPLLRANVAFQAVPLPSGKSHVHLFYADRAFEIGAAISGIALLSCCLALVVLRRAFSPPSGHPIKS